MTTEKKTEFRSIEEASRTLFDEKYDYVRFISIACKTENHLMAISSSTELVTKMDLSMVYMSRRQVVRWVLEESQFHR